MASGSKEGSDARSALQSSYSDFLKLVWESQKSAVQGTYLEAYFKPVEESERPALESTYREYLKQVEESEGFDVEAFPALKGFMGRVVPLQDTSPELIHVIRFAKMAIEKFNRKQKTAYEFVEVLKANYQGVSGIHYFVTFSAKKKDSADTETFQTKVLAFMGDKIMFVRLKPQPSTAPPSSPAPNTPHVRPRQTSNVPLRRSKRMRADKEIY